MTELRGIHILLQRLSENPDAPASEISPFTADRDKDYPFTHEELARMALFLFSHAPTAMASLPAIEADRCDTKLSTRP